MDRSNLGREISDLLKKYSIEDDSNTPDFLLARAVLDFIVIYGRTIKSRDKWYGFDPYGKPPDKP